MASIIKDTDKDIEKNAILKFIIINEFGISMAAVTVAEKLGMVDRHFSKRLQCIYADRGKAWLDDLPNLLAYCAKRWNITVAPKSFPRLSYNYVVPAKSADNKDIVLKVGVVNSELISEIDTLTYLNGRGSVKLFDADKKKGVLILEQLKPGKMLIDIPDAKAAVVVANIMKKISKPLPTEHDLQIPLLKHWFRGLDKVKRHYGPDGPLPKDLVKTTEEIFAELEATLGPKIVLHGDLHHYNVLSINNQGSEVWRCIDPKGYIGEAESEVGPFLRNPLPLLFREVELEPLIEPRLEIFSDILGYDIKRMLKWSLVQSIIAACWCIEDNIAGWGVYIKCARLFEKYLAKY